MMNLDRFKACIRNLAAKTAILHVAYVSKLACSQQTECVLKVYSRIFLCTVGCAVLALAG